MSRGRPLTAYAGIAVVAAGAVIVLKLVAWWMTGSVGLLSDAVESTANLAGALMALAMLRLAARPPDDDHAFGHSKAEYFSSGFEGALILVAGAAVLWLAFGRLFEPQSLVSVGPGLFIAAMASILNLGVARLLLRAGQEAGSIALEAGGRHLMADVWTSVGVIAGVGLAAMTGWAPLDALVALAVGAHVLHTGAGLLRRSALGLLDTALEPEELERIDTVLQAHEARGIRFHALRTRRAGRRCFVSMHVLVPGDWSVQRAHDVAEVIEREIEALLPGGTVFTHLEPVDYPASFRDETIRPL